MILRSTGVRQVILPLLVLACFLPSLLPARAASAEPVVVERYHLQSNPWVNLHQRLMHEVQFESPSAETLSGEDAAAWRRAVEAYREFLGDRSALFDDDLVRLNAALSETQGPELPASIPAAATEVLRAAMPIYERTQWPQDDRVNRFWIALAEPMLASAAAELIAAHERTYGIPFPPRIRVDVSARGWRFGAYTVGDRLKAHAVVSSADPSYQGFAALEMLLHEPSHAIVARSFGAIGGDLARAAEETGREPPRNLWHAILFYTSGELTRRALAERGIRDYEPYMYKGKMFEDGFRGFQGPLETHWQAWLDGEVSREEAVRRILLETTEPEGE